SKGGNYLLNIGPKPDGTFPTMAVRRLREIGGWMAANAEAVYGTDPVLVKAPQQVCLTQKSINGKNYMYASLISSLADSRLVLPVSYDTINSIHILDTGMPLKFEDAGNKSIAILLPQKTAFADDGVTVLKMELK
ncbi:MAG TPA: alpha-L-fucosidase, partial [Niabella sp.]|nr:alpha-L-fucosidase [Niabella sp.]